MNTGTFRWCDRYIFYLHIKCLLPRLASRVKHRATYQRRNISQTSVPARCSRWFGMVQSHVWSAEEHNQRSNVFQKWFFYYKENFNNFHHQQTAPRNTANGTRTHWKIINIFKLSIPSHFVRKYPKKISPDKIRDTSRKKSNAWKIWMRWFISNDFSEVLEETNKFQTMQFWSEHI